MPVVSSTAALLLLLKHARRVGRQSGAASAGAEAADVQPAAADLGLHDGVALADDRAVREELAHVARLR